MTLKTGGTCTLLLCYHELDRGPQDYVRGKQKADRAENFLLGGGRLRAFSSDPMARHIKVYL